MQKIMKVLQTVNNIAFVTIFTILCFGCTVKVPMNPNIGSVGVTEKIRADAALLIKEETRNYVFRGNPESFTMGGRPHEFPFGLALETSSLQTFSQIFKHVTLIRNIQDANNYKVIIEPKIEDFHFRYDQLSYAGFAVAVLSKVKVQTTLANGEKIIWEKIVESPEIKKGPWAVNLNYDKDVGESASEALAYSLKKIALEMAVDNNLRELIEKQ